MGLFLYRFLKIGVGFIVLFFFALIILDGGFWVVVQLLILGAIAYAVIYAGLRIAKVMITRHTGQDVIASPSQETDGRQR